MVLCLRSIVLAGCTQITYFLVFRRLHTKVVLLIQYPISRVTALTVDVSPKPPTTPLEYSPPSQPAKADVRKIPIARANASIRLKLPRSNKQLATFNQKSVNKSWDQYLA
jgi:hypothetical protein